MREQQVALGLRANGRQFTRLVLVNGFVGTMVGLERTVVPLIARAGCKLLISMTSAGQIVTAGPPPCFVLIERALRMKVPFTTICRRQATAGSGTSYSMG